MSRVVADVDQFADGLLIGFTQLFTGVVTILGTLCFMLSVNVGITLVVVVITPISLFVASFIAKKTFRMFKLQSETRGEQTALINALKNLIELGFNEKHLLFVLDSKYVLNAINQHWLQGWKKRGWKRSSGPLKNVPEWKELDRLLQSFPDSTFEWTKGHANNRGNEYVDHALNRYMDEHM